MKKLLLTMIVSFALCGTMFAQTYSTHWPDFDYHQYPDNKGLVAYVNVDGQYAAPTNYQRYEVAAFVGNECRGASFLQDETGLGDAHPAFQMQVYYDAQEGQEQLSFKLYDHVEGVEYSSCTPKFFSTSAATTLYTDNWYLGVWGEPSSNQAIVLEFVTAVTQSIELKEGYNWVSFYVEGDPVEMLGVLQESLNEHGVTIEGTAGINYNLGDGFWWGDLDEIGITSTEMYLIEVDEDCTIELPGVPCDPSTTGVTIEYGYNWISFPNSEEVEVNTALEGFEAGEEDMIEGPDGMIYYLGDGYWWGDFETFVPGQGYLYYYSGSETQTLYFQTGAKKVRRGN